METTAFQASTPDRLRPCIKITSAAPTASTLTSVRYMTSYALSTIPSPEASHECRTTCLPAQPQRMDIDKHKHILLQTSSLEHLGHYQRTIRVMCLNLMYKVVRLKGMVVSRDSLCHNASLLSCATADMEGLCDSAAPVLGLF